MKKIFHPIYIVIALIQLVSSCNQNEEIIEYNPDLVFPNASAIDVDPYFYIDSGNNKTYFLNGDAITDTLGSFPVFRWRATNADIETVVISKSEFIVSEANLINAEQIIWQWHKGMKESFVDSTGNKYSQVAFLDGKQVLLKNIIYETQPLGLENGLYFWAIWSWDKSGTKIAFSSKQMQFIVK
jgi:hypothetical protein